MIPCRVLIFFKFQLRIGLVVFGFSSFGPSFGGGGEPARGVSGAAIPALRRPAGTCPSCAFLYAGACWCMVRNTVRPQHAHGGQWPMVQRACWYMATRPRPSGSIILQSWLKVLCDHPAISILAVCPL